MNHFPVGAVTKTVQREGRFVEVVRRIESESAVFFVDTRVLQLHPHVRSALRGHRVMPLRAGENVKSIAAMERLARQLVDVSRAATFVAVGGGTIGDVVTVLAHLHKRGVRLVQVPTTLLAAVDSSVGGKGAVNVASVKNALGVFHSAAETWLCFELFSTLSETQRREGRLEAWKMAVTLDAKAFRRWCAQAPDDLALVKTARRLKERVVAADPYERTGIRVVLNFGHTFGHVFESITDYRVRHGEAVGLGMLCALEIGASMGVTPRTIADAVGRSLPQPQTARRTVARLTRLRSVDQIESLLKADKKSDGAGLRMVLLTALGRWQLVDVSADVWKAAWKRGFGDG